MTELPASTGQGQPEMQAAHPMYRTVEDPAPILVRDLFALIQLRRLRGPDDSRVRDRAEGWLRQLAEIALASGGPVRIVRAGPHLRVNGLRVASHAGTRLALGSLRLDLERLGAGGFEFSGAVTREALEAFLAAWARGGIAVTPADADVAGPRSGGCDLAVGIRLLPPGEDAAEAGTGSDLREQARQAFFRALGVARSVARQVAVHRAPELRKSREVVHEMVDSLTEERFSLLGLAAIQDFDPYTYQHSVHVSILALALGQELGLSRRDLADLGVAALFHDMGKIQIPKDVLQKPGCFGPRDWAVMRTHPLGGARALLHYGGRGDLAERIMLVSAEHHMRFDGSGYPRLGADWQQGLFSRLVSLADCFDAMTASRTYMRRPFTPDAVVRYMLESSGRMFDPDLLRLFVAKVGLFPVGSLVRLESGELAVVVEPPASTAELERPRVRTLGQGRLGLVAGEERTLAAGPAADPRGRIRAGCHPQDHGVDVDALLTSHLLPAAASGRAAVTT
jgi:HD-GYP domain-containing protein (c-di-GMP phosphodiesterase class II)